jgi:hypothetical protein
MPVTPHRMGCRTSPAAGGPASRGRGRRREAAADAGVHGRRDGRALRPGGAVGGGSGRDHQPARRGPAGHVHGGRRGAVGDHRRGRRRARDLARRPCAGLVRRVGGDPRGWSVPGPERPRAAVRHAGGPHRHRDERTGPVPRRPAEAHATRGAGGRRAPGRPHPRRRPRHAPAGEVDDTPTVVRATVVDEGNGARSHDRFSLRSQPRGSRRTSPASSPPTTET